MSLTSLSSQVGNSTVQYSIVHFYEEHLRWRIRSLLVLVLVLVLVLFNSFTDTMIKKNNSLSNVDEDLYCFFLCSHASFLFTMHCYGLSCTSVDCLGLPWRLRVIVLICHAMEPYEFGGMLLINL